MSTLWLAVAKRYLLSDVYVIGSDCVVQALSSLITQTHSQTRADTPTANVRRPDLKIRHATRASVTDCNRIPRMVALICDNKQVHFENKGTVLK